MLTRNRLLAGTAALVALSLVGPAAAQAPIKIGELNSYKVFPPSSNPTRRASSWRSKRSMPRRRARPQDRGGEPRRQRQSGRCRARRRGAAEPRGRRVPDRHLPVERRLAVADFAKQRKVLFIAAEPLTDKIVWDQGNAYTFRLRTSTYMQTAMLIPDAAKLNKKRWAIVYPNYEYGQSATAAFKKLLKEKQPDVEFVAEQAPPLGKIDAGAVAQAWRTPSPTRSSPRCSGPDLAKFVREGQTRGLFKGVEVFNLLAGEPEYLDPLKEESPDGWYVTGYPWSELKTPEHTKFLNAYQAKFKDYPRLGSVVGYATVMSAVEAIKKAGSLDQEKLVAAMKGLTLITPFGMIEYRPIDHQSTMGAYVGQIGVKDGKGYMKNWRFVDGKDALPSDADVQKMRPKN